MDMAGIGEWLYDLGHVLSCAVIMLYILEPLWVPEDQL